MPPSDVFVHDRGLCESEQVGTGTRVWAFAHVMPKATVGHDCNIGNYAFIENGAVLGDRVTVKNLVQIWEGVTVEDDVFLGPGCMFTNDLFPRSPRGDHDGIRQRYASKEGWLAKTTIAKGATIGASATIIAGTRIGSYAMVAAGAVVTRDVPDHAFVIGQPARHKGWVCYCGRRLSREPKPGTLTCECGASLSVGE